MNQRLFHHELTRLKLEQLHHEARVHDLLKHSREQNGAEALPRSTARTVVGSLLTALKQCVFHILHAGSAQAH